MVEGKGKWREGDQKFYLPLQQQTAVVTPFKMATSQDTISAMVECQLQNFSEQNILDQLNPLLKKKTICSAARSQKFMWWSEVPQLHSFVVRTWDNAVIIEL